jgi:4'-phosphopantetheinyl transferase
MCARIASDEVHVWRSSFSALPELPGILSRDELDRAARFHFEKDRGRFIAARAWLRTILARYLDTAAADIVFQYGLHGKPSISGAHDLRFNLSHSGNLVLLAITQDRELGIDVEFIKESTAGPEIAERFFSEAEVAELHGLPEEMRQAAFFAGWTRKEAYIKATGVGLFGALDRFSVLLAPDALQAPLCVHDDEHESNRWKLRSLNAGEGYAAALAVEGDGWELRCLDWPADRP